MLWLPVPALELVLPWGVAALPLAHDSETEEGLIVDLDVKTPPIHVTVSATVPSYSRFLFLFCLRHAINFVDRFPDGNFSSTI